MIRAMRSGSICAAVVCLSLVGSAGLRADVTSGVTSRSGFTDIALWPMACVEGLPSATTTSAGGVTVTATDAGDYIDEDIQVSPGCEYDGWFGNFAPGDGLLWTDDNGPVTLSLSSPVNAIGTQIMTDFFGPFTAEIQIYDGGTLLGSFTEGGVSADTEDNSAIFIGMVDSTGPDITSAVFSVTACTENCADFTINDVSLSSVSSVPEPGTFALWSLGLASLMVVTWWRRRSSSGAMLSAIG